MCHLASVAGIQAGALALQVGIGAGVLQGDLGLAHIVLRLGQVDLGHRAASKPALVALQLTGGGLAFDPRLVSQPCGIGAGQPGIELGAPRLGFQPGQGGLFLGQPAAQLRTVDHRQLLALLDHVAGHHLQGRGAGGDRVQHRAVGGDHAAVGGDVAHQIAAADGGDAQPRAVERARAAEPALGDQADAGQHDDAGHGWPQPATPLRLRVAGDFLVLGGGVANHRRRSLLESGFMKQNLCQTARP